MAWRATSLKAMFCAVSLGAAAITATWPTRSGNCSAQDIACMPPSEPPTTAAKRWMPSWSARRACDSTQSSTVTKGKSAPHSLPVAGLIWLGPDEP